MPKIFKLKKLKYKVIVGSFLFLMAPVIFFSLLFFITGGSFTALPPVATEEKAIEYATTASKMGVPWDLVLIADAIKAEAEGKGGIEDINPLVTCLQFLLLREQKQIFNGDAWNYASTQEYAGKAEILAYLGVDEEDVPETQPLEIGIQITTPDILRQKINDVANGKSSDQERYSVYVMLNPDYEQVLRDMGLSESYIEMVLELYNANYLASLYSSSRINEIRARYGMYQYSVDGDYSSIYDGVSFTDGAIEVIYYNQKDSRWRNEPYGTDNIGGYACGPTSMSIVVSSLTGQNYDPIYMAQWAYNNSYWCKESGSYNSLIPGAAQAWGFKCETADPNEKERIIDALRSGNLVVAIMGAGHFTTTGHFIVLRGTTDWGGILVADPNSLDRSQMVWDFELIASEVQTWGSGPFWIIG